MVTLTGETAPFAVGAGDGDVVPRSGDTVIPRCLLLINRLSSCVASPPRPEIYIENYSFMYN